MDGDQAVARARALYRVLPKAGFSQATFEELGTAARFGRTFESLSAELKATFFVLVRDYSEALNMIEVEEGIKAAGVAEDSPSGTTSFENPTDTSGQEPDEKEDEATPESVGVADTEPSPSPDDPANGITPSIPAPEDYPAKPGIEQITP